MRGFDMKSGRSWEKSGGTNGGWDARGAGSVMMLGLVVGLMGLSCGGVGGCAAGESGSPRTRIGALPFPGVASLYAAADPMRVAPHRYRGGVGTLLTREGDRGIIYTERAGFVDMAHVRLAMDWTWYLARLIEASPAEGGVRRVGFRYETARVEMWVASDVEGDALADVAGLMAYRLLTWHEVSTWYGYSMVAFVSERRSTFTVDDTTSHVLGVEVGRGLVRRARSVAEYDAAADEALGALMRGVGAMEPAETTRMCGVVEGIWWEGSRALVFDAHVALGAGEKRPMVVTEDGGVAFGEVLEGVRPAGGMRGVDTRWEMEVFGKAGVEVERVLGGRRVRGDADLERLIEDVALQMEAQGGVRVVRDADVDGDSVVASVGSDAE